MTAADLVARRRACHGTRWCCQRVDEPMCNSPRDPHLLARGRFLARSYLSRDYASWVYGCAIAWVGRRFPRGRR